MSQYFQWLILSSLTGSPIGSAIFLLAFWFTVDRFTLGILPDPIRWVMRRRREAQLNRIIIGNPHDGRARLELAQLLNDRGAFARAVDVLKPTLENGANDIQSVFSMGEACLGAGYTQQGTSLMAHARELDPDFRLGEIDYVVGREQLKRKDFAGAKVSLESFVHTRKGTIQGRVMLAQALNGLGDDANAALLMDKAWDEYVSAPPFQRRRERWWAWRARPSRPAIYFTLILVGLFVVAQVVGPQVAAWSDARRAAQQYGNPGYRQFPPGFRQGPAGGVPGQGPQQQGTTGNDEDDE